jgi:hypothetical protein
MRGDPKPTVLFESAFDIPSRLRGALERKTTPCVVPPPAWTAAGLPVSLVEVMKRFDLFQEDCIEQVKARKRRAAGPLAHLLPQHPDDLEAVFTGTEYVRDGVVVGLVVSFIDHAKRAEGTHSCFSVLRVDADRYFTLNGPPAT